jgi:S-adenosylmethionine hydrolase
MEFGETTTKFKGKGMRNAYIEALFEYADYKKISTTGQLDDNNVTFRNIVKRNFGNIITSVDKVALSSYDDKWFIYKEDGETKYLPYGHKDILEKLE